MVDYLANYFIRPERQQYSLDDLGASVFYNANIKWFREDIEITSNRGHMLKCSHFRPLAGNKDPIPCVVYAHGNAGCRLDALNYIELCGAYDISFFCFDFAGCGLSEGDLISLGWFEKNDIESIVLYLQNDKSVSDIILWGRSMGAVSCLLYSSLVPDTMNVKAMILDSAFSSLEKLAEEIVRERTGRGFMLVNFFLKPTMNKIRANILERCEFDILNMDIINQIQNSTLPAMFLHGSSDTFVNPEHSINLHNAYPAEKYIFVVEGDHNSQRCQDFMNIVSGFLADNLDHITDSLSMATSNNNKNFLCKQLRVQGISIDMLRTSQPGRETPRTPRNYSNWEANIVLSIVEDFGILVHTPFSGIELFRYCWSDLISFYVIDSDTIMLKLKKDNYMAFGAYDVETINVTLNHILRSKIVKELELGDDSLFDNLSRFIESDLDAGITSRKDIGRKIYDSIPGSCMSPHIKIIIRHMVAQAFVQRKLI
eukprot:TRINITY_DN8502_c0_g1_i1.p1 TRINITY_DN8502_c0_g1~~TRINITY_DN8502_c0_g1_i1.p1  ORF type:complete len:484 (+),score=74.26 TRINITY_DN8502_c0_g1_i1:48-1499(+)